MLSPSDFDFIINETMVTAYNLHFDVLSLIFSYLSANDLVRISLVSKSFLSGVTPRLYHSLVFSQAHVKKYPQMMSPFSTLLSQPSLGVYVRACEITAFPLCKGQPNKTFLAECIRALDICPNLARFYLALNALPSFLALLSKKDKLKELRVNGSLTSSQAEALTAIKGLRSVRLDHASWCLMNLFPRWASILGSTLTCLIITLTSELNETVLEESLVHLSNLRGLHVRNCMKIDHNTVFRLIAHTPHLESLSITSWENPTMSLTLHGSIRNLRYLYLDARNVVRPPHMQVFPLWRNIIGQTQASNAPLTSLTLHLTTDTAVISDALVQQIIDAHADSLTSLRFVRVYLTLSQLRLLVRWCRRLERLALHINAKSIHDFIHALAESFSLKVLVNEPDRREADVPVVTLKHDDVRILMMYIPTLRYIFTDSRIWRGSGNGENLRITLERSKSSELPSVNDFP